MNTLNLKHEALLCGRMRNDGASNEDEETGLIFHPPMRDWGQSSFILVSNKEKQKISVGLDPAAVGKLLLQAPCYSIAGCCL